MATSSVISQKGESQNGRTRAYQGVRNVHFSENLACFVFLKHPFWDSPIFFITEDFQFTPYGIIHLRNISH